jgi:hypothetical protein
MRELKYYVACTVDRFIAREDGSFDFFLMEGEQVVDLLESFPETIPAHFRGEHLIFVKTLLLAPSFFLLPLFSWLLTPDS